MSQKSQSSEEAAKKPALKAVSNRSTTPVSVEFKNFISSQWAERDSQNPELSSGAKAGAGFRKAISELFAGQRLIIPAGEYKQRSNDTDYPFRAHSAFSHLTGWGADSEPDAVLVFEPAGDSHEVTLYFRERASRDSDEFYANPQIGEFWIGARPSLEQVSSLLGVKTRALAELEGVLEQAGSNTLVVREAARGITDRVDAERLVLGEGEDTEDAAEEGDARLAQELSELRLVKTGWEIAELQRAIDATAKGFDDIIRSFPEIVEHDRGERLIEGVFYTRARSEGNAVGYDTIAASGANATILHWTRNTGKVQEGDLVLIDAGIEVESLYTADITRTLPVSGTFSPVQRMIYEAVREAADAAFAIVKPGIRFREVHQTAMEVIAQKTFEWGLLPVKSVEETLDPEKQFHRRYMVHGTSHHLGLDVHDCAQARRDLYLDGILQPGFVFTIEPGLYFQADDLTVPEEFRGIGVRIEDDILVTEDGAHNLSAEIPRTADEVEAWIARLRS